MLVKLSYRDLVLVGHGGPKLIRIDHYSWLRLLLALRSGKVLLMATGTDARPSCSATTPPSSHLPGGHSVPVMNLLGLGSSETIVIKIVE